MKLDIQRFAEGKLIIGTEVDTSGVDEGLKDIENETNDIGRILEKKFGKVGKEAGKEMTKEIESMMEQIEPLAEEYGELMAEYMRLTDKSKGSLIYESDIKDAEELKKQIRDIVNEIEKITGEKITIAGLDVANEDANRLKEEIENIGSSIKKVTRSVVKWGLALMGVSGVFSFIRSSISTISQQDKELANDLNYIKTALAYSLEPVVRVIVDLMKQLLILIGGVVKLVTGRNIFAETNKGLASANKQATSLKKQLSGFDEMNVLSDTSSGDGGGTSTQFDPSLIDNMAEEITKAEDKWKQFGEEMKQAIDLPWDAWIEGFGEWGIAVEGVTQWVYGLWEVITGFFEFVKGVIDLIVGLITGDTDLIFKGITEMLDGLWKIIDGVIQMIVGGFNALVGVVIGAIVWLLKQAWNILSGVGTWIYNNIIKPIADFFVGLWNGIIDGVKLAIQWVKDVFNGLVKFFSGIINTILGFFKKIGTTVGDVIGGAFKSVINGVLSAIENILNFPIKSINKLINTINAIPGINLKTLSTFKLPRLARGGIVNNPGPGVMMGSYVAGEKGPEAVIPLDDDTLDRLGLAFARHTQINATVPVYVGNRQIAREIRKINAEDDFAFNV